MDEDLIRSSKKNTKKHLLSSNYFAEARRLGGGPPHVIPEATLGALKKIINSPHFRDWMHLSLLVRSSSQYRFGPEVSTAEK